MKDLICGLLCAAGLLAATADAAASAAMAAIVQAGSAAGAGAASDTQLPPIQLSLSLEGAMLALAKASAPSVSPMVFYQEQMARMGRLPPDNWWVHGGAECSDRALQGRDGSRVCVGRKGGRGRGRAIRRWLWHFAVVVMSFFCGPPVRSYAVTLMLRSLVHDVKLVKHPGTTRTRPPSPSPSPFPSLLPLGPWGSPQSREINRAQRWAAPNMSRSDTGRAARRVRRSGKAATCT